MPEECPIDSSSASALAPCYVGPGDNQSCQIAAHAARLRSGTDAICRFSGGEPAFEEGRQVLVDYCDSQGFWADLPPCCHYDPDAYGDEHEVWFVGDFVIKLTNPDFYGLKVIYRPDGDKRCLPVEYFERWQLHNRLFGDDVEILGAVLTTKGPRMILKQKAVEGFAATMAEIADFFTGNGWVRFVIEGQTAWFDEHQSLVISDTHQGNLIKTPSGVLVPIDFRIQPLSGALLDAVKAKCR